MVLIDLPGWYAFGFVIGVLSIFDLECIVHIIL